MAFIHAGRTVGNKVKYQKTAIRKNIAFLMAVFCIEKIDIDRYSFNSMETILLSFIDTIHNLKKRNIKQIMPLNIVYYDT